MTKDNLGFIVDDFIIMRHSIEPQACALAAIYSDDIQQKKRISIMKEMVFIQNTFDKNHWIETDMAYHELVYDMSGNAFMTSFANLFCPVYYNYFTAITDNKVVKLDLHQAIVDAICQRDSQAAFSACVALLNEPISHE